MDFLESLAINYLSKVSVVQTILEVLAKNSTSIDHAIAMVLSVLHHLEAVKAGQTFAPPAQAETAKS